VTPTECAAAFARARDTILDAKLSRPFAERIRDGLRARELCAEQLWELFFERHQFDAEPGEPAASEANIPAPDDWIQPGAGLAARPVPMARVSLSTILPTLHVATRRGIPTGSVTGIEGGPDTAKTGTATAIADAAEQQGFVVVHMTDDNGREAAEIRWGQMMGFDRTQLEEGDETTVAAFREIFAKRTIWMPDPDAVNERLEQINTLSHVIEEARRRFPDKRVLLLPDSITAVRPDAENYESPRLRVIATMKLLRKAASTSGWLVVAPCQINREAFRNRKESKNTNPITAGAESSSIEFGCDLLIYLSTDDDGIRALVTKNKPGAGRRPVFRISWNREQARASEPDAASFEAETLKIAEEAREAFWGEVEQVITENPGLSTTAIRNRLKRRLTDVTLALQDMAKLKPPRVRLVRKGAGYYWYRVEATEHASRETA
jgi:KaiC/GvpD/RAD55 family RecA-like ATPase